MSFLNKDELESFSNAEKSSSNIMYEDQVINPQTPLEKLPRYEQFYGNESKLKREEQTKTNEFSEYKSYEFKKQKDNKKELNKIRAKILITCYLLITLVLTVFFVYNIVSMVKLNNKISNNNIRITEINKNITKKQAENAL